MAGIFSLDQLKAKNPNAVLSGSDSLLLVSADGKPVVKTVYELGKFLAGITIPTAVDDFTQGARVELSKSLSDYELNTTVNWADEIFDSSGFWSVANGTQYVIPAGVSAVDLVASLKTRDADSGETITVAIIKNGDNANPLVNVTAVGKAVASVEAVPCVQGDYFTVVETSNSGVRYTTIATESFFTIRGAQIPV